MANLRVPIDEGAGLFDGTCGVEIYDEVAPKGELRGFIDYRAEFARRLGDHIEFARETVYRDGKTVRCYMGLALRQNDTQ